jgi:GntR family transcriptional regulator
VDDLFNPNTLVVQREKQDEPMPKNLIDRTSPTPFYFQLKQILKGAIEANDLVIGDAIPTEKELMELYEISRATVRQAVLELVNEGYLRREKGKGTFVTQPPAKIQLMQSLKWFSAEMNRKGIPHTTRILESAITFPPVRIAEFLQIDLDTEVFYLRRLRSLNDRPYLIDKHYIPHSLCVGIEDMDLSSASLYQTLFEAYDFDLHHGWREFQPAMPSSKEEIELLGIYANTPILLVESTVFSREQQPLDYFELKLHGKFTANIVNAEGMTEW